MISFTPPPAREDKGDALAAEPFESAPEMEGPSTATIESFELVAVGAADDGADSALEASGARRRALVLQVAAILLEDPKDPIALITARLGISREEAIELRASDDVKAEGRRQIEAARLSLAALGSRKIRKSIETLEGLADGDEAIDAAVRVKAASKLADVSLALIKDGVGESSNGGAVNNTVVVQSQFTLGPVPELPPRRRS